MEHISESLDRAVLHLRDSMPEEVKRQWAEKDREEARYIEKMRAECAEAISRLAEAIRRPRVARSDLEEAQRHFLRALSIAGVLDPEEVS